jgi:hypothetical protein
MKLGSRRVWPVDRGCLLLLGTWSHFRYIRGSVLAHLLLWLVTPSCVSRLITLWYLNHFVRWFFASWISNCFLWHCRKPRSGQRSVHFCCVFLIFQTDCLLKFYHSICGFDELPERMKIIVTNVWKIISIYMYDRLCQTLFLIQSWWISVSVANLNLIIIIQTAYLLGGL